MLSLFDADVRHFILSRNAMPSATMLREDVVWRRARAVRTPARLRAVVHRPGRCSARAAPTRVRWQSVRGQKRAAGGENAPYAHASAPRNHQQPTSTSAYPFDILRCPQTCLHSCCVCDGVNIFMPAAAPPIRRSYAACCAPPRADDVFLPLA